MHAPGNRGACGRKPFKRNEVRGGHVAEDRRPARIRPTELAWGDCGDVTYRRGAFSDARIAFEIFEPTTDNLAARVVTRLVSRLWPSLLACLRN